MSTSAKSLIHGCYFSLILSGCAIHPLPDEVTGLSTGAIVRKIRCEARDAVITKALAFLASQSVKLDKAQLEKIDLQHSPLPKDVNTNLIIFSKTGIVLDFSLQGTESGAVTLGGSFVKPIPHGTFALLGAPALGANVQRDNIRSFTISDSFLELVQKVPDSYCNFEPGGPDYRYPITGQIGVAEMIDTFIDLTVFSDLGAKSAGTVPGAAVAKHGPPTMTDQITFITTIQGGLTPSVTLSPVGTDFQLANASLGLSAMRVDHHVVIIGLGLPSAPVYSKNVIASLVTATPGLQTGEAAAVQAVNQSIERYQISRPQVVAP